MLILQNDFLRIVCWPTKALVIQWYSQNYFQKLGRLVVKIYPRPFEMMVLLQKDRRVCVDPKGLSCSDLM